MKVVCLSIAITAAALLCSVVSAFHVTVNSSPFVSRTPAAAGNSIACSTQGVISPCCGANVRQFNSVTGRRRHSHPRLSMMAAGPKKQESDLVDRALCIVPYILPLLDGIDTGRYVFQLIPGFGDAFYLLFGPLSMSWKSSPLLPFIVFLVFTFLSRSSNLPRNLRFNLQQAVLIDISLIIFSFIGGAVNIFGGGDAAVTNFTFYYLTAAIIYSTIENIQGKAPNQIPFISQAAEMALGPF